MSTELQQLRAQCSNVSQYIFERLKEEFDQDSILPDNYQDVELCAGKTMNE